MLTTLTYSYLILAIYVTSEIINANPDEPNITFILLAQVIIFAIFVLCHTALMTYQQNKLKKEAALSDVLNQSIKTHSFLGLFIRNIFAGLLMIFFIIISVIAYIILIAILPESSEARADIEKIILFIVRLSGLIVFVSIPWFLQLGVRIVYGKNNIYNQQNITKSDAASVLDDDIHTTKPKTWIGRIWGTSKTLIGYGVMLLTLVLLMSIMPVDDYIIRVIASIIIMVTVFKIVMYGWSTYKQSRLDSKSQGGIDQIPPELSSDIPRIAHVMVLILWIGMAVLSLFVFYLLLQIIYWILPENITHNGLFIWLIIGFVITPYLLGAEHLNNWLIQRGLLWLVRKIPEDQLEFAIHNSNYHTIKSTLEKIPDTPLPLGKKFIVALGHHIIGNYQESDRLSKEGVSEAWALIKDHLDARALFHDIFDHYLMLLAENAIVQGKQDQALDIIKRALKVNRKNLVIYNTLCEWYYINGDLDKIQNVIDRLNQLPAKNQTPLNYYLFEAINHAHQNNKVEAHKSLETAKKKINAPVQEANYHLGKGRVEIILGNYAEARKSLEQAQQMFPTGAIADYVAFDLAKLPS